MSFESPLAFLALAPFAMAIAFSLRDPKGRSPRALLIATLRMLAICAIAAALARPYQADLAPSQGAIALVDISSSLADSQGQKLLAEAQSLARHLGAPLRILPFAKTASTAPQSPTSYTTLRAASAPLDPTATNIEAALLASRQGRAPIAFLLSDGYESTGHALAALSAGGAPRIFPLTVDGERDTDRISISQLFAPQVVKSQQRAEVRVTLSNPESDDSTGTLTIKHGPAQIFSKGVSLPHSGDTTFTALTDPSIEGLQPIVATYSWKDERGSHSVSKTTWLSSEKRDKVLLLSGTPEDDRFLSQILRGQAYQLRSEIAGQTTSAALGAPNDYRAIILNNVAANAIPSPFSDAIPPFVRNGGGLVTVGGDRSYGLGGYIGSQFETLLPVRLVPPHLEKKRLNVAVQLVIDKSRSMAMDSRLEFAKSAAREVLNALKDDDYIGVIGFDDVPFIALPLSPVGNVRNSAAERISRLYPTKKTNLFPALDEARRGMARINAGRKHVIVLTDGKLPDPGPYYFDLVRQMRVLGVTVSTVVVGNDADDGFLAQLAELGGGSFYQTVDPQNLPKIFLSDVKVASNEKSLKESQEIPVSVGPSGVISTQLSDFPTLRGFVETLQRESAKTELIVTAEEKSFPLLASWTVDKGKVISFTSDANSRWSSLWMQWRSINEFWSDIVESTIGRSGGARSNVDFEIRSWVEGGEVVVDLSLFDEIGAASLGGELTRPSQEKAPLSFAPVSPGHYQARVPKAAPGRYAATVSIGNASLPEVAWEISDDTFTERPHFKPNMPLLQQIASRSGGLVNPDKDALTKYLQMTTDKKDLSRAFASLALLLFILELLVREFGRVLRVGRRSLG
jgi:Ca-activated chloride channel homolog